MLLFHGTTLWRANLLLNLGPVHFHEPGGYGFADEFSAYLAFGPINCTDRPEVYAVKKSNVAVREGRDEGRPAILLFDVPDDIIALAVDEVFPLSRGFVQFDRGPSMDALLVAWPTIQKRVISFAGAHP